MIFALALIALPPDPAMAADAGCLYVMAYGSEQAGTPTGTLGAGALYYLGKLRRGDPTIDVPATVTEAVRAAKAAGLDPQADVRRCRAELQTTSAPLAAVGQLARARARATNPRDF